MLELKCPNCSHIFYNEDRNYGDCPNCHKAYFHWEDGWNSLTKEFDYDLEGYEWRIEEDEEYITNYNQ